MSSMMTMLNSTRSVAPRVRRARCPLRPKARRGAPLSALPSALAVLGDVSDSAQDLLSSIQSQGADVSSPALASDAASQAGAAAAAVQQAAQGAPPELLYGGAALLGAPPRPPDLDTRSFGPTSPADGRTRARRPRVSRVPLDGTPASGADARAEESLADERSDSSVRRGVPCRAARAVSQRPSPGGTTFVGRS